MEEKKKFEKPELKVVQLKTAPVMAGSGSTSDCTCNLCPTDYSS